MWSISKSSNQKAKIQDCMQDKVFCETYQRPHHILTLRRTYYSCSPTNFSPGMWLIVWVKLVLSLFVQDTTVTGDISAKHETTPLGQKNKINWYQGTKVEIGTYRQWLDILHNFYIPVMKAGLGCQCSNFEFRTFWHIFKVLFPGRAKFI